MLTHKGSNENHKGPVPMMTTLSSCINKVVSDGYNECFKVTNRGLYSTSLSRYYRPEQVQVVNFYRFEGQTDPGDNAIMYVLETSDGLKGTLIDGYGVYADSTTGRFMAEVEDIRKKMSGHNRNFC